LGLGENAGTPAADASSASVMSGLSEMIVVDADPTGGHAVGNLS
jgi:hypothetical protein